jgi:hypothetical protein
MARSEETGMPGTEALPDQARSAARFYPVERPVAPQFHPELGYLCPSASVLRKLRSSAVMALVGLAMAASVVLAFAPRPAADNGAPDETAVPVLSASVPALSASVPVEGAAPAPAIAEVADLPPRREVPAATARAQVECDDFLASFLAAQCRQVVGRTGKARSARTARAQAHRLATVTIGRAAPEADPHKAGTPSVGTKTAAAADAAGGAAKPVATAAAATDAATLAKPKAPVRTVHKERRPSEDARLDAATAMARGGYWGGGNPRGGVIPFRFGGTDWARSW